MSDQTHNLLIVSDLHISAGFRPETGKLSALEDFINDDEFNQFLRYHDAHREVGRPWRLIIAGDLFDFLQIVDLPAKDITALVTAIEQLQSDHTNDTLSAPWSVSDPEIRCNDIKETKIPAIEANIELFPEGQTRAKFHKSLGNLATLLDQAIANPILCWHVEKLFCELEILTNGEHGRLTPNQIEYGLGTSEAETCWKLDRIAEGHPTLFQSFGWFISQKNQIVILHGNHDVELCWDSVKERMKQLIQDAYPAANLAAISFAPWIYYEENLLYLEHGNQYEAANSFHNMYHPVLQKGRQEVVQLPIGSFFVRYLFNKIEASYPFADNLRPVTRFLSWAYKHDFLSLTQIMLRHSNDFLYTINRIYQVQDKDKTLEKTQPKQATWIQSHEAQDTLPLATEQLEKIDQYAQTERASFKEWYRAFVPFIIPLVLFFLVWGVPFLILYLADKPQSWWLIGLALFSYLIKRYGAKLFSFFENDGYLVEAATHVADVLNDPQYETAVPYIIMGHTHQADVVQLRKNQWYINTGSWLHNSIEESEWIKINNDYSFCKIIPGHVTHPPILYRWHPEKGIPERLKLRS